MTKLFTDQELEIQEVRRDIGGKDRALANALREKNACGKNYEYILGEANAMNRRLEALLDRRRGVRLGPVGRKRESSKPGLGPQRITVKVLR